MKKYIFIALAFVLLLSASLIAYGVYLNFSEENKISDRMDNRAIPLHGSKAKVRAIRPELYLLDVELQCDDMADIVALSDGRITDVYVKKNEKVTAGQPMFSVVDEKIPLEIKAAESNVRKAETQLARARNSYNRYVRLWERNATSQEKMEEAEASFREAEAGLDEMLAKKQQLQIRSEQEQIVAPIDGEVIMTYRTKGTQVQTGTALATIGGFQTLSFSKSSADDFYQHLRVGEQLHMTFNQEMEDKIYDTEYGAGNKGAAQEFTVTVQSVTPEESGDDVLKKIRMTLDNSLAVLEPKTYVYPVLQYEKDFICLTVPVDAVEENIETTDPDDGIVFVATGDNTIEKRAVLLGVYDGEYIEVHSGLQEGDVVITSGHDGLKDGMKINLRLDGDEADEG